MAQTTEKRWTDLLIEECLSATSADFQDFMREAMAGHENKVTSKEMISHRLADGSLKVEVKEHSKDKIEFTQGRSTQIDEALKYMFVRVQVLMAMEDYRKDLEKRFEARLAKLERDAANVETEYPATHILPQFLPARSSH